MNFEPWNYSHDQLLEIADTIDFWNGEPLTDLQQFALDELRSWEDFDGEQINCQIIDRSEIEELISYKRECSFVRSWIIKEIGCGDYQKIVKMGEFAAVDSLRSKLDQIAQRMTDDRHIYSSQFIAEYMPVSGFSFDTVLEMIRDIPNRNDTEKEISMLKNELKTVESEMYETDFAPIYRDETFDDSALEFSAEMFTRSEMYETDREIIAEKSVQIEQKPTYQAPMSKVLLFIFHCFSFLKLGKITMIFNTEHSKTARIAREAKLPKHIVTMAERQKNHFGIDTKCYEIKMGLKLFSVSLFLAETTN